MFGLVWESVSLSISAVTLLITALPSRPIRWPFFFFTQWSGVLFFVSTVTGVIAEAQHRENGISNTAFAYILGTACFCNFAKAFIFWWLYIFKRNSILPPELEANFPFWLNCLQHLVPSLSLLTYVAAAGVPVKIAYEVGVPMNLGVVTLYIILTLMVYYKTGGGVYAFMQGWGLRQFLLFGFVSLVLTVPVAFALIAILNCSV